MATIQELRNEAYKVIHETQEGGNSSSRIGNLYNGIIDFIDVLNDRTIDPYYYDDSALKEAIRRVDAAIAELDRALEAALALANQERQRLDDLVNTIDDEIQDKVSDMLEDAQWLEDHAKGIQEMVNEGEIYWKSEWDQNIEQYLQEVGVWAREGDVVKTQWTSITQDVASIESTVAEVQQDLAGRPTSTQWSQITQKVNGIEQTVNALLYQGDVTEALQSSINQSIDGKVAALKLDTTYAKIDTEGSKEIIEWMYSALRNETTSEKTFNDIVSAGKSGLLNGISNVHTYVEVVRKGEVLEHVAGAAIEAKVNDAVTGLYSKATTEEASTSIFSQVKKDTQNIAAILVGTTGSSSTVDIVTRLNEWKAGLIIKSDLDSAKAELITAMDEKDNAAALLLESEIDNSYAAMVTRMDGAVALLATKAELGQATTTLQASINNKTSAVYLQSTLESAIGQLITATNYSSAGIASSASVNEAKADMHTEVENATSAVSLKSTLEGAYGTLVTANNISGYTSGFATKSDLNSATASMVAKSDYNAASITAMVNSAGSSVLVNADHINFKTGTFSINNGSTTTFSVDSSGNVTMTGTITSTNATLSGDLLIKNGNSDGLKLDSSGNIVRWNGSSWVNFFAQRYAKAVSGNYTCGKFDDIILVSTNGAKIYMPSSPENGRQITVRNIGTDRGCQIRSQYQFVTGDGPDTGYDSGYYWVNLYNDDRAELVYYGGKWYWNAMAT